MSTTWKTLNWKLIESHILSVVAITELFNNPEMSVDGLGQLVALLSCMLIFTLHSITLFLYNVNLI